MFQTCPITSVADHGLGSRFGSSRGGGSTAAAFLGGRGHLVRSQRWLGCAQLKDCDIGSLWGWEANRGEYVFEFLAGPTRADPLLRLPHTDDVQGSVADRAVMAQFPGAGRAPAAHDQRMCPVVGLPQLVYVAVEAGNQHDGHSLPPNVSSVTGQLSQTERGAAPRSAQCWNPPSTLACGPLSWQQSSTCLQIAVSTCAVAVGLGLGASGSVRETPCCLVANGTSGALGHNGCQDRAGQGRRLAHLTCDEPHV